MNHFRKALNLIHYLLHENNSDCSVVTELGFPRIMMHLVSSDEADVREAALRGLLKLAGDWTEGTGNLAEKDEKLKQVLQVRIHAISCMGPDDLEAAREERQLIDSLWSACYNEPSPLREKGLLVLSTDDVLPPDVASKLFEPPLRAWAPNRTSIGRNSGNEKKEVPLLLGLEPSHQGTQVQSHPNSDGEL